VAAEIVNPRSDSSTDQEGGAEPLDSFDPAFALHRGGKMAVQATVPVRNKDDLSLAYTPGVAKVCTAIAEQPELVHDYTWKSSVVAVVTDGTAVLGLGDIGPEASLPVMEGKAILFKQFGGVDAVPIALACTDVDEIVETVVRLAPSFGGVNLEDISAPRCFEIERAAPGAAGHSRLPRRPARHGRRHAGGPAERRAADRAEPGAAAGVISGAGAAGVAIAKFLLEAGLGDVAVADRKGIVSADRDDLTPVKAELAAMTNKAGLSGSLESALAGADVFIGVSGGTVPEPAVASMAEGAFVFAMANPDPEVHPDVAHKYAAVVATGRSDFPNQINNVLAFPGIFAGRFRCGPLGSPRG
jgi:malate dehydrogenase (oxaloacetate-decarboxylating)